MQQNIRFNFLFNLEDDGKMIIKFWCTDLYHFRRLLGSPGGLATLFCTLKLKIEPLVNELS